MQESMAFWIFLWKAMLGTFLELIFTSQLRWLVNEHLENTYRKEGVKLTNTVVIQPYEKWTEFYASDRGIYIIDGTFFLLPRTFHNKPFF